MEQIRYHLLTVGMVLASYMPCIQTGCCVSLYVQEILANQDKDNRYLYCLDKLGEMQHRKMEYHIIEKEDLRMFRILISFTMISKRLF